MAGPQDQAYLRALDTPTCSASRWGLVQLSKQGRTGKGTESDAKGNRQQTDDPEGELKARLKERSAESWEPGEQGWTKSWGTEVHG